MPKSSEPSEWAIGKVMAVILPYGKDRLALVGNDQVVATAARNASGHGPSGAEVLFQLGEQMGFEPVVGDECQAFHVRPVLLW